MGILVEYTEKLDARSWQDLYDTGAVPDRWPYGLDRLAHDPEYQNLVDLVWTDKPAVPRNPVFPLDVKYTGMRCLYYYTLAMN